MVCTGDWPRASLWGLVMAGQRFCMGFAALLGAPHHPLSAFLPWLWDPPLPPASTRGTGAASAIVAFPFAAVTGPWGIIVFLFFLFITTGAKGSWGC